MASPTDITPGVVFFGTGDGAMARTRLLKDGARQAGFRVYECTADPWRGCHDKTVAGRRALLVRLLAVLCAYPRLLWRYVRLPQHQWVIVTHPGWLDVLVLWPFAQCRGAAIVWDAFLPLAETLVDDRRLVPPGSLRAWLLWAVEYLVCRASSHILCDTLEHARYMQHHTGIARARTSRVFVGAEENWFHVRNLPPSSHFTVLFYGQFIPLHGADVIVEAASLLAKAGEPVSFIIVGSGQEAAAIDERLRQLALPNVTRRPWIPYEELGDAMASADVCLGIFGDTPKASRVIPNKIFQALACRKPVITRDSPAIRELLSPSDAVWLIPPGDAQALANAILQLRTTPAEKLREAVAHFPQVSARLVSEQLRSALDAMNGPFSFFGPAFPEHGWVPAPRYLMRRDLVLSHLKPLAPGRVLEIGTGSGALLHELARAGWDCTGVEDSPQAYALAGELAKGLPHIRILPALPAEPTTFDCLLAFEVLEHIEDDAAALRSWMTLVKPGGKILLSVPGHARRWSASDILAGHYRRYSREEFMRLAAGAGCAVESVECYGWPLSNVIIKVRSRFDQRRMKRMAADHNSPERKTAYSHVSGITRRPVRLYRIYSSWLGRHCLAFFLKWQRRALATEKGNGYLLAATRKP